MRRIERPIDNDLWLRSSPTASVCGAASLGQDCVICEQGVRLSDTVIQLWAPLIKLLWFMKRHYTDLWLSWLPKPCALTEICLRYAWDAYILEIYLLKLSNRA